MLTEMHVPSQIRRRMEKKAKKGGFREGCLGGHDNLNDVVTMTFLVIM